MAPPGPSDDKYIPGPLGTKIDDEEAECLVTVVIPGVKKPKFFGLVGKNTDVDLQLQEQSLRIYCELEKKSGSRTIIEKCLYRVQRLPGKVDVNLSYYDIKPGQIVIHLVKQEPGSWQNIISQYGLETAQTVTPTDEQSPNQGNIIRQTETHDVIRPTT